MNPLWRPLLGFVRGFEFKAVGRSFFLCALVGIVAGLGAVAFQLSTQALGHFTLGALAGFPLAEPAGEHNPFSASQDRPPLALGVLLLLPAAGGLLAGLLVRFLAPEAEGHGTDAAIHAFHHRGGRIRARIPLVKMVASAITISTGGSGGREGPIAQIGAGFGSVIAGLFKLSTRERRLLMAAGLGAGVGAIFRAPLAGALFASEILYRDIDFETDVIMPAVMASVIAFLVYSLWLPGELRFVPLFGENLNFTVLDHVGELGPLLLLSLAVVLVGALYTTTFHAVHRLSATLPMPKPLRAMLGGLLTGVWGVALFLLLGGDARVLSVMSVGYGVLQDALHSVAGIGLGVLIAVALGKIVTTSLTIGSGGSGGVFGPSMVIGGCTGAACGLLFHQWWPELVPQPEAYVILGMIGLFSGIANTPISTVLMVFEMTGSYRLLVATMFVAMLSFLLSRRFGLYHSQVANRYDSPAHRGSFVIDVLANIRVRDVYDGLREVRTVPEAMTLDVIVHRLLPESEQTYFPVVNEQGLMVGIFTATDIRRFLFEDSIWNLAIAKDFMVADFVSVSPDDDLNDAMGFFAQRSLEELPVIDPENPGVLLGMLRRGEAVAFYNQRVLELKREAHKEGDASVA